MTDSVEIKRQHAWGRLYNAANAVAARIGADGEISTRSPEISTLMDALAEIDGGQWCPGITPYATALPEPAPPAQPADIVNPISQQNPVAWRHSETGQPYDSEEEVPLADGDEWAEPLYLAAPAPPGYAMAPIEPTPEMVAAYLAANTEYWRLVDGFPPKIGVWRNGTPSQATAESYRAMIAAAKRVTP